MAKEKVPAWQQVLRIALNDVPKARNGQDAWEKLNAEEQAAVMDFLGEHCGSDAQAALEETCAMLKPRHYRMWPWVILLLAGFGLLWLLLPYLEAWIDLETVPAFAVLCVLKIAMLLMTARKSRMQNLWRQRGQEDSNPAKALQDMLVTTSMSRWRATEKPEIALYMVFLAIFLFLLII